MGRRDSQAGLVLGGPSEEGSRAKRLHKCVSMETRPQSLREGRRRLTQTMARTDGAAASARLSVSHTSSHAVHTAALGETAVTLNSQKKEQHRNRNCVFLWKDVP